MHLQEVYGGERQRGKTLNFSIAYGKTAHGLSKDWDVSLKEAEEMLEAWYADRPEVRQWQQETVQHAQRYGVTRTLLGRYRPLPGILEPRQRGHMERAAINTPIQGGAADIMTLAMLKLQRSEELKKMGYKLLLQVHDEVMLEGPEEYAEAALAETVACMEHPFDTSLPSLLVDLAVDAKTAKTWYEAK
jgi:DNA polymerase-1